MATNVHEIGEVTKLSLKADGEALITHSTDGKLQSCSGRPSSARLGADRSVIAAAWRDEGVTAQTWRAGIDVGMTIDLQVLACECHGLADEFRCFADWDAFADALDQLGVRAADLGGRGYVTLPMSLDADRKVNMLALDEYVMAATNTPTPPRR
jgi:hypothetical protein